MRAVPTTAEIDVDRPGRIRLGIDYRLKDHLTDNVPGAKWDKEHDYWHVPLGWPTCLALRAEFGDDLEIGPNLKTWAAQLAPTKKWLRYARSMVEPDDTIMAVTAPLDSGPALYPFQRVGAALSLYAQSYLFIDDTGTGKTYSLGASARLLYDTYGPEAVFPLLIVCPKSVILNWASEIRNFWPDADIRPVIGTHMKRTKALEPGGDIYIMSYGTLPKHSRVLYWAGLKRGLKAGQSDPKELQALGIKTVIADEIHRIKNPTSDWTRALWAVGDTASFRLGATGTWIQENMEDMWAALRFIAPNEYPNKSDLIERYAAQSYDQYGVRSIDGISAARAEEFFSNLDARFRRLPKDVAAPWLPEKVSVIKTVTMTPKVRKAYQDMEKNLYANVAEGDGAEILIADSPMVQAGRLTQLAQGLGEVEEYQVQAKDPDTGEALFDEDGQPVMRIARRFLLTGESPKVDAFMEDVLAGDYSDSKVVVYSDNRQVADRAMAAMRARHITFTSITGDTTAEDREQAKLDFQAGKFPFIVITRAGAEGITLTAADTMVRLTRSWSLITHHQSEDRVHRLGSEIHDVITLVDYIVEDTIEEDQIERLASKEATAQEVLRDDELRLMLMRRVDPKGYAKLIAEAP